MLSWAITFLVVGLIAGVLGVSGVAGTARRRWNACSAQGDTPGDRSARIFD
jgi:F0F1-type ATP synthase assembly protein I